MKIVIAMQHTNDVPMAWKNGVPACVGVLKKLLPDHEIVFRPTRSGVLKLVRQDPADVALLVVDITTLDVAEELRFKSIYEGHVVGISNQEEQRNVMKEEGVIPTNVANFVTAVRAALVAARGPQNKKIVVCLSIRDKLRDQYLELLSKIRGYDVVSCHRLADVVLALRYHSQQIALIVVGYESRTVAVHARRTGHQNRLVFVSEDPKRRREMQIYGVPAVNYVTFEGHLLERFVNPKD